MLAKLLPWQDVDLVSLRAKMAQRRNKAYVKSEKLLALVSSRVPKRILFSEMPDWAPEIQDGFRRLPHQVEFGPISEDSFRRYDIVVPLTLPALKEALLCSPAGKKALPLPTPESVQFCDDKYEFNLALTRAGLGQFIPKMTQGLGLKPPYILKRRTGWWGTDCYVIRDNADQAAQLDHINDPEYFCQEFIPGSSEFATHILFVEGRIVKALNIKYEFAIDMPIKGQNRALLHAIHRCPYLDLFAKVLRIIGYEGLCCVNYKVADGRPYLLEINPRFGGSLAPYFFSFIRHLH